MTFDLTQYVQERDEAVRAAVMEDDLEALVRFSRRYGIDLIPDDVVIRAAVCKTACAITTTAPEVVAKARETLAELGMSEDCWTMGRGEQTEAAP